MSHDKFGMTVAEGEREHFLDTLEVCAGNGSRASRILQISVHSLRMKLHQYIVAGFEVVPLVKRSAGQ